MYSITIADRQPKTYARLEKATEFADAQATELGIEVEVIHVETEAVAYLTSTRAILKRDVGAHFHPWTRLETPKFSAPHFEGWYPAYTRKRIEATVYRSHDDENEKPWRVHDGRTGRFLDVANTTESRKLLTAMKNGRML
jgi:hypothetical protein